MIRNLSSPWDQYAAIQADLARGTVVDDGAWGLERALNQVLFSSAPPTAEEVERAAQNESRRERHHAQLRRRHQLAVIDAPNEPESMLEARHQLRLVQRSVNENDWKLLSDLGTGSGYAELAASEGVPAGTLRVRAQRARTKAALPRAA